MEEAIVDDSTYCIHDLFGRLVGRTDFVNVDANSGLAASFMANSHCANIYGYRNERTKSINKITMRFDLGQLEADG